MMIKRRKFDKQESITMNVFNNHISDIEGWLDNFPDNEEKKFVIQKLSEASMWAGACMANKSVEPLTGDADHTCDYCRNSRVILGHYCCGLTFECIEDNEEVMIIAPKLCPVDFGRDCKNWRGK